MTPSAPRSPLAPGRVVSRPRSPFRVERVAHGTADAHRAIRSRPRAGRRPRDRGLLPREDRRVARDLARWPMGRVHCRHEGRGDERGDERGVARPGGRLGRGRRVSARGRRTPTAGAVDANGRLRFVTDGRAWDVDPATPEASLPRQSVRDNSGAAGARGRAGRASLPARTGSGPLWCATRRRRSASATFASEFEKRHEDRFKGVQFDWLDFQRDGQPFPVPNRAGPAGESTAGNLSCCRTTVAPSASSRALALRPVGTAWNQDGHTPRVHRRLRLPRRAQVRREPDLHRGLDGTVRRLTTDNDVNHTNARYSPDGRWILYTRQLSTDAVIRRKLNHGGATDLAILPADGGAGEGPDRGLGLPARGRGVEPRQPLRLLHGRRRRRDPPVPRVA